MKYIKIVNILIIVMMLTTVLIPAVEASANYEIKVTGKQFVVTGYLDWFDPEGGVGRSIVVVNVNGINIYNQGHSMLGRQVTTTITYTGIIDTIHVSVSCAKTPRCRHPLPAGSYIWTPQIVYADIYRNGVFLEREHFTPPIPTNLSHALNFTLASAMLLPTMTIGKVDDIMLIIGRFIDCGITKFTIRATLLKAAAKGVAVVTAITAVGYLFSHFTDEIYHAIFTTVPEIKPGDTHFHEIHLPRIMEIIDTYYPVKSHIRNAIEQAIRAHIDAHGYISIAKIMEIIRNHQRETVITIYKETPEILPENIPVHKDKIDDTMKIVDKYFPVETPVRERIEYETWKEVIDDIAHQLLIEEVYEILKEKRDPPPDKEKLYLFFPPYVTEYNLPEVMELIDEHFPVDPVTRDIIEEELYNQIQQDLYNEIPFEEVVEIIEEQQHICIPEIPVETPEQHLDYITDLETYQDYKDEVCEQVQEEEKVRDEILDTVIYDQTPGMFDGICEIPIKPRDPTRPKEKLHTFPFYSIFIDPIANVIGIKLAHLFGAMLVVGSIISIATMWGATAIGGMLGGLIGTLITSYFGLTSWLIPLYLILVFIIYLNIKIRKGSDTG